MFAYKKVWKQGAPKINGLGGIKLNLKTIRGRIKTWWLELLAVQISRLCKEAPIVQMSEWWDSTNSWMSTKKQYYSVKNISPSMRTFSQLCFLKVYLNTGWCWVPDIPSWLKYMFSAFLLLPSKTTELLLWPMEITFNSCRTLKYSGSRCTSIDEW